MALRGLHVAGALLALCLLVAGAHADDAAAKAEMEKGQSVYLPTTTNDYSGMIYSLLQEQAGHLAGMEGADDESNPLNLLATMAGWAQQAQTALFTMSAPSNADSTPASQASLQAAGGKSFQQAVPLKPDPINTVLNQTTAYANIISNAHVDPIPTNLVRFLVENPLGPQLDAALKALPSITDPIGKQNASASFGAKFAPATPGLPAYFAKGGANSAVTQSASVLSYRPCFFSQGATGVAITPQLIVVNPRIYTSTFAGVAVTPKLIEVQPAVIKVKPVGVNVSPTGVQVYPRLINVGPQVNIAYPATPPPAKKAGTSAPKTAAAVGTSTSVTAASTTYGAAGK